MDGVEILNQVELHKEISIWLLILIVALFVVGCSAVAFGWSVVQDNFFITVIFILLGLAIFSFMIVEIKDADEILKEPSGIIEYQVTIDDNVVMNKFYDKYEIMSVDGKIYTVREVTKK